MIIFRSSFFSPKYSVSGAATTLSSDLISAYPKPTSASISFSFTSSFSGVFLLSFVSITISLVNTSSFSFSSLFCSSLTVNLISSSYQSTNSSVATSIYHENVHQSFLFVFLYHPLDKVIFFERFGLLQLFKVGFVGVPFPHLPLLVIPLLPRAGGANCYWETLGLCNLR